MSTKLLTTPPDERMSLPDLLRLLRRALLPAAAVEQSTGTWTPTDASGAALTLTETAPGARYTRHGNLVFATFLLVYPATADGSAAKIGGLPFTSVAVNAAFGGLVAYTDQGAALTLGVTQSATTLELYTLAGAALTNANLSGKSVRATVIYEAVP